MEQHLCSHFCRLIFTFSLQIPLLQVAQGHGGLWSVHSSFPLPLLPPPHTFLLLPHGFSTGCSPPGKKKVCSSMYPPGAAVPSGISIYSHMGPARATVGICSCAGPPQATGSIHSARDPLCHSLLPSSDFHTPFFCSLPLSLPPTFP